MNKSSYFKKKKKDKIFKKGLATRGIGLVLLRLLSKKKKSKFSIPRKNSRFPNFFKKTKKIINQIFNSFKKFKKKKNSGFPNFSKKRKKKTTTDQNFQKRKRKKKEGNFQKGPWDKGHYARTSYVAFKKKIINQIISIP